MKLQSTKFIQFVCISFYQLKLYLHTIRFNALPLIFTFKSQQIVYFFFSSISIPFSLRSVFRYFDFEVLIISFISLFFARWISLFHTLSLSVSVPVSILRMFHLILTHRMCICIQARQPNTIKQQSNRNTASTIETDRPLRSMHIRREEYFAVRRADNLKNCKIVVVGRMTKLAMPCVCVWDCSGCMSIHECMHYACGVCVWVWNTEHSRLVHSNVCYVVKLNRKW